MEYDARHLVILEFDEAVRRRPEMYFWVAQDDPRFPTAVLESVGRHALHPATAVAAEAHTLRSTIDILHDRSFTITPWCPQDLSADGYYESLLTPTWCLLAAAAAISERGVVEVWSEGTGLRQELIGLRPSTPKQKYGAARDSGMRVTLHLDPAYVRDDFALPTAAGLDLHSPYCEEPPRGGSVLVRDLRPTTYL